MGGGILTLNLWLKVNDVSYILLTVHLLESLSGPAILMLNRHKLIFVTRWRAFLKRQSILKHKLYEYLFVQCMVNW